MLYCLPLHPYPNRTPCPKDTGLDEYRRPCAADQKSKKGGGTIAVAITRWNFEILDKSLGWMNLVQLPEAYVAFTSIDRPTLVIDSVDPPIILEVPDANPHPNPGPNCLANRIRRVPIIAAPPLSLRPWKAVPAGLVLQGRVNIERTGMRGGGP